MHLENFISNFFHIEWDMIVVTVFLSISNQMEFHLVQNRKENCHHDQIPFNVKGKLSPRSDPIQFERKWKYSFLGVFQDAIKRFQNEIQTC